MTKKKEQKIIVLLSLTPSDKVLILNGIKIASIFKKELCLLYNYPKKNKKDHEQFKNQLLEYTLPIKNELPNLKVSTLILSKRTVDLPDILSDDYEAIFLISSTNQYSFYASAISESPVPFLFVDENSSKISEYKNLVLPLDLRTENSDSALWSSYFGRFNGSGIVIIAAKDSGKDEQKQVAKNVILTQKLFRKFKIHHKTFMGEKSSFKNAFEALNLARESNADLLIILGSSAITPLDYMIGLPEQKILKQAENLPVLVINPRKDNYILCD